MKFLPYALLAVAGLILGRIAWRAPERSYVPLAAEGPAPLPHVPRALIGDVPEGYVVRTLEVGGMCCTGCTAKVHDALTSLPAVERAAVDFERGTASALVPMSFPAKELAAALLFDKYTATVREAGAGAADDAND